MVEVKRYSLVKPTINTPFHIDFEWWQQNDREWRVHLLSCLPAEYQQTFAGSDNQEVDWIDPETAEVHRVDGFDQTGSGGCGTHTVKSQTTNIKFQQMAVAICRLRFGICHWRKTYDDAF